MEKTEKLSLGLFVLYLIVMVTCSGCSTTHQKSTSILFGAYQSEYYDTKEGGHY